MKETMTVRQLINHLLEQDLDLPVYYSDPIGEENNVSESDFYEHTLGTSHKRFIIEF